MKMVEEQDLHFGISCYWNYEAIAVYHTISPIERDDKKKKAGIQPSDESGELYSRYCLFRVENQGFLPLYAL